MKSRHCAATNPRPHTFAAGGIALAVGAILMAGTLPAQAQTGTNTAPDKTVPAAKKKAASSSAPAAATDEKSKASYSLGLSFGTQLHGYGLGTDAVSYERVMQGFKDALAGKVTAGNEDGQRIQAMIQGSRAAAGTANKAAAVAFLATNGKQPGVMTTASGLQYKVIRAGSGDAPKTTDDATVNYRGTLLDGTEFDSSYKRNQPATFTVGKVIPGWIEGLQLMKPGAKFELYIPPELAYGMEPPPPIPPGSLLKFEVELISVKPGAAPAAPALGGAMSGPKHP
ncbi:MAG TPA: FKBP-type peptidyl-prolyl cis-trans isomerase [Steroidobacteraceae bacterium]|nr:FKBP-type peptidyl-prolyl cis-trans isomerase [Steroidobacteraceae bacterium]